MSNLIWPVTMFGFMDKLCEHFNLASYHVWFHGQTLLCGHMQNVTGFYVCFHRQTLFFVNSNMWLIIMFVFMGKFYLCEQLLYVSDLYVCLHGQTVFVRAAKYRLFPCLFYTCVSRC